MILYRKLNERVKMKVFSSKKPNLIFHNLRGSYWMAQDSFLPQTAKELLLLSFVDWKCFPSPSSLISREKAGTCMQNVNILMKMISFLKRRLSYRISWSLPEAVTAFGSSSSDWLVLAEIECFGACCSALTHWRTPLILQLFVWIVELSSAQVHFRAVLFRFSPSLRHIAS